MKVGMLLYRGRKETRLCSLMCGWRIEDKYGTRYISRLVDRRDAHEMVARLGGPGRIGDWLETRRHRRHHQSVSGKSRFDPQPGIVGGRHREGACPASSGRAK